MNKKEIIKKLKTISGSGWDVGEWDVGESVKNHITIHGSLYGF